jgi:transposase
LAADANPVWPVIEAVMALRGISLLAAETVVAGLDDLAGFPARRN